MPDTYEILEVENPEVWDEFVHGAIGGSIFSTRAWLQLYIMYVYTNWYILKR